MDRVLRFKLRGSRLGGRRTGLLGLVDGSETTWVEEGGTRFGRGLQLGPRAEIEHFTNGTHGSDSGQMSIVFSFSHVEKWDVNESHSADFIFK